MWRGKVYVQQVLREKSKVSNIGHKWAFNQLFSDPTVCFGLSKEQEPFAFAKYFNMYFWSPDGARGIFASSPALLKNLCPKWQAPRRLPSGFMVKLPSWEFENIRGKRKKWTATISEAILLMSGGIDSTVIATDLKRLGIDVHWIAFLPNYKFRSKGNVRQLQEAIKPQKVTTVISRKEVLGFLSDATRRALRSRVPLIITGGNLETELHGLPQAIAAFNECAAYNRMAMIQYSMPLAQMTNKQVIEYGQQIDAPMRLTTSCPCEVECGTCFKCKKREMMLTMPKRKQENTVDYKLVTELAEEFGIV
jgi:7-cyano-7-deazaguanine synthase in queuosine biosynthesis